MKFGLVEFLTYVWADKHNISPLLLELYHELGEEKFMQMLQRYSGETIVIPLPSEYKKLLLSYDVYVRYNAALKKAPKDVNIVLYTKGVVETIAKDTGFTPEEIIDMVNEMHSYLDRMKENGK